MTRKVRVVCGGDVVSCPGGDAVELKMLVEKWRKRGGKKIEKKKQRRTERSPSPYRDSSRTFFARVVAHSDVPSRRSRYHQLSITQQIQVSR